MRLRVGLGVFAAATPKPNAGCITKKGAARLSQPLSSATSGVGAAYHAMPAKPSGIKAKATPIA